MGLKDTLKRWLNTDVDVDDDTLEGEDEHGSVYVEAKHTENDQIDAITLFADVNFEDPLAVAKRKQEWGELFGV